VQTGAILSQADSGVDPNALRRYAQSLEAAGFDHLMVYDHVLGASPDRLSGGKFGSFGSPPYTSEHTFHEVLMLFSHLAAVTTTLRFVTSVLVLPQRQTPLVAKQVSTLDLLSEGRLDLAVGVGWNWAEYEAMGADFAQRTDILEEQIHVLRLLWTEQLVTFSGRHHQLDRIGINPSPSRPIPIFIGSKASPDALRRVVRLADGWMPLLLPGIDTVTLADGVRRLREIAADEGRDPATLPIHGRVYFGDGWQGQVEQAIDLGFARLSVGVNRIANPGLGIDFHLESLLAAKGELDSIVGPSA
jgi:probable F420-dependent oxidoreductase